MDNDSDGMAQKRVTRSATKAKEGGRTVRLRAVKQDQWRQEGNRLLEHGKDLIDRLFHLRHRLMQESRGGIHRVPPNTVRLRAKLNEL